MFRTTILPRLPQRTILPTARAFSNTPLHQTSNWKGSPTKDHVTEDGDKYNVEHDGSKLGREERAEGGTGEGTSNATSIAEKDGLNSRSKAKKEHPKAPGPIIGMEDERGGVSYEIF
ncbi:hypothetical protein CJF30_00000333 [Rutstroemia sp. NJR-2017a BBW]|nr:hypothetical protein CJF30_00000333 [Rutstroemia sp. NJR-2017a BBW]